MLSKPPLPISKTAAVLDSAQGESLKFFTIEDLEKEFNNIANSITRVTGPEPLPEDFLLIAALKRIPLLTSLLDSADSAGSSLGSLLSTSPKVDAGFSIGGLAISGFHFLKLPLIYMAARVVGQKMPPIGMSKASKWLYSGVALGLSIAALVAAPAVVPALIVAGSVLGGGVSVLSLAKSFYEREEVSIQLSEVQEKIKVMRSLQDETRRLESELDTIRANTTFSDQKKLIKISKVLITLRGMSLEFEQLKPQELLNKEDQYLAKLHEIKDPKTLMDKGVAVFLGGIAIAGAVALIIFPPAGMGLLAASALLSGAYLLGRLAAPWIQKVGSWIKDKLASPDDNALLIKHASTPSLDPLESTEKIMNTLVSSQSLKKFAETKWAMSESAELDEVVSMNSKSSPTTSEVQFNDGVALPISQSSPEVLKSEEDEKRDGEGEGEGISPH